MQGYPYGFSIPLPHVHQQQQYPQTALYAPPPHLAYNYAYHPCTPAHPFAAPAPAPYHAYFAAAAPPPPPLFRHWQSQPQIQWTPTEPVLRSIPLADPRPAVHHRAVPQAPVAGPSTHYHHQQQAIAQPTHLAGLGLHLSHETAEAPLKSAVSYGSSSGWPNRNDSTPASTPALEASSSGLERQSSVVTEEHNGSLSRASVSYAERIKSEARPTSVAMSGVIPADTYAEVYEDIGLLKVDQLKAVIKNYNYVQRPTLIVSGRKDELIRRLRETLVAAKDDSNHLKFNNMRDNVGRQLHRPYVGQPAPMASAGTTTTGGASGSGNYGNNAAGNPYGGLARAAAPTMDLGNKPLASGSGAGPSSNAVASTSTGFRAFGSGNNVNGVSGSGVGGRPPSPTGPPKRPFPMHFQSSPFWRYEDALTTVMACPKAGQGDRKVQMLTFTLNNDQRLKLLGARQNPKAPQYQVRLFCTSEDHYFSAMSVSGRPPAKPAPTEYPQVCDIRLNEVTVPGNTRGIKKQPGTAVPPDMSKAKSERGSWALDLNPAAYNRAELIFANTDKKHYIIIFLVEYQSVPRLMTQLNERKVRSKDEVLAEITKKAADDEIVMSSSACDLRDPLSMMRIKQPIRSTICSHLQCFDAETFFEMMEQTPTWKCPVCNKVLPMDNIFVDGYMKEILGEAPSSVDSVIIEADGTWRDEQNKYGTAPSVKVRPSSSVPPQRGGASSLPSPAPTSSDEKGKRRRTTEEAIDLLDDEDDDGEGWGQPAAKRYRSEAMSRSNPITLGSSPDRATPATRSGGPPIVIDLTDD